MSVDRNSKYMKEMWGTTHLITDYYQTNTKKVLQEVLHDQPSRLVKQSDLHQIIRNDDDYDDWEYGTEPIYQKPQTLT